MSSRAARQRQQAFIQAEAAYQARQAARLEYLRQQIRQENISYGEIAELQGLAEFIDPADTELLQWAGVEEQQP
jgi:hypothetical protein